MDIYAMVAAGRAVLSVSSYNHIRVRLDRPTAADLLDLRVLLDNMTGRAGPRSVIALVSESGPTAEFGFVVGAETVQVPEPGWCFLPTEPGPDATIPPQFQSYTSTFGGVVDVELRVQSDGVQWRGETDTFEREPVHSPVLPWAVVEAVLAGVRPDLPVAPHEKYDASALDEDDDFPEADPDGTSEHHPVNLPPPEDYRPGLP